MTASPRRLLCWTAVIAAVIFLAIACWQDPVHAGGQPGTRPIAPTA